LRAGGPQANPKNGEEYLFWFGYPGRPSAHASMGGAPWAIFVSLFQGSWFSALRARRDSYE